jgi:hypothetical protein
MRRRLAVVMMFLACSTARAQSLAPRPEDVGTIDGIIQAFYDVISGPAGTPRQWQRDSTLYIPRVRFVAMDVREGRPVAAVMDHAEFVGRYNAAFVDRGFFEREIHRVTKRFGNIAHVFSTYEYRATEKGPVQGRGVNSIQLFWDGTRWWIAGATWDDERPDNPIPAELR